MLTVMEQYGSVVDLNLLRDKETGKSMVRTTKKKIT